MNIASQFDVIRSDQKDEFYRSKLSQSFASLAGHVLRPQSRLKYNNEIQLVSDFIYYFYTNLSNRQTIGQEYTNLTLFDESKRDVPSMPRRAILVALKLAAPYAFNKYAQHDVFKKDKRLRLLFFVLKLIIYYSIKLNRIAFFLANSSYYRLENRLTRAKYLSLRYSSSGHLQQASGISQTRYLLGMVEVATFLLQATIDAKDLYSHFADQNAAESITDTVSVAGHTQPKVSQELARSSSTCKCMLCLDGVYEPTATFCGHVYCWSCINNYAASQMNEYAKLVCPSCRVEFDPRQLIFLHNFK